MEFLTDELGTVLAAADIVVSRAGIATLSELSYLGKATILVPISGTNQEEHAAYFAERGAAVAFRQNELDGRVVKTIKTLLESSEERARLSASIKKIMKLGARERIVAIVKQFTIKN